MLPVVSFGEALIDFIPVDDGKYYPFVGGAPANVAAAIAKLGGDSHFVGGISEDSFGELITKQLQSINVILSPDLKRPNKTAMVVVSLDDTGERTFQFYRDDTADLAVCPQQLAKINWSNMGIFHFCSNTMTETRIFDSTLYALAESKKCGAVISFDVNLRLNLWCQNSEDLILQRFHHVVNFCDIIKFSDEELAYLCTLSELNEEAFITRCFDAGVKLVLVTAGSEPVAIITPAFTRKVKPPAAKVVDTTAGGDSFIGGFLFQLSSYTRATLEQVLTSEQSLVDCVTFGSQCGAYTVANKGAISALPHLVDLKLR